MSATVTARNIERAREIAASIFSVTVDHITEAPRYCGDGVDGDCARDNWGVINDALVKGAVAIRDNT